MEALLSVILSSPRFAPVSTPRFTLAIAGPPAAFEDVIASPHCRPAKANRI
jgi:hypothetical protein